MWWSDREGREHRAQLPKWLCLTLLLVLMGGCAGGPPEVKPLLLQVVAAPDLNARSSGGSQNVDVMVLQLADLDAFGQVDLLDLYPTKEIAEAALGGSLISMNRYQFAPSEERTLDLQIDPNARHLGVVVAFEQYHLATWRASVQLREEVDKDKTLFRKKRVYIALDALAVSMQLKK